MTKGTRHQSSTTVAESGVRAEGAHSARQYVSEIDRPVTNDQIAQRAYELYLNRGGQDGAELDDWLQAERELRRSGSTSERRKE